MPLITPPQPSASRSRPRAAAVPPTPNHSTAHSTTHRAAPLPTPPAPPLRPLADRGWLRCAVPVHCGGLGGEARELGPLMAKLRQHDPALAALFWSQRLAIEFLVQTPNGALREHLLPDVLRAERAATVPITLAQYLLSAHDTGRGWQLSAPRLQAFNTAVDGFSFVAPVQLDGQQGWCCLRSEEDGFDVLPAQAQPPAHVHAHTAPAPAEAQASAIRLRQVFFREDEWLGEQDLEAALQPVCAALGPPPTNPRLHVG